MARLTSTYGRGNSEKNLVWYAPKPSQSDKLLLAFGEIVTLDVFLLLLGLVALYFSSLLSSFGYCT